MSFLRTLSLFPNLAQGIQTTKGLFSKLLHSTTQKRKEKKERKKPPKKLKQRKESAIIAKIFSDLFTARLKYLHADETFTFLPFANENPLISVVWLVECSKTNLTVAWIDGVYSQTQNFSQEYFRSSFTFGLL